MESPNFKRKLLKGNLEEELDQSQDNPKNYLKRKKVYDPKEAIKREKSNKRTPVKSVVDSKWKRPPGTDPHDTSNLSKSMTGKFSLDYITL